MYHNQIYAAIYIFKNRTFALKATTANQTDPLLRPLDSESRWRDAIRSQLDILNTNADAKNIFDDHAIKVKNWPVFGRFLKP